MSDTFLTEKQNFGARRVATLSPRFSFSKRCHPVMYLRPHLPPHPRGRSSVVAAHVANIGFRPQSTLMHRAQLWIVCGFWACATAALLGFCEIGDGRTGHNFGGVGGGRPLWLGHETTTTTHRYVEANLAMKEKALARIQEPDTKMSRYQPPDDLTKFLQAL